MKIKRILLILPLLLAWQAIASPPETITTRHEGQISSALLDPLDASNESFVEMENGSGGHTIYFERWYPTPRLPDANGKIWLYYSYEDVTLYDVPPWTNTWHSEGIAYYCTTNNQTPVAWQFYDDPARSSPVNPKALGFEHHWTLSNIIYTNQWGNVINLGGQDCSKIFTTGSLSQYYRVTVDMQILVCTPNGQASDAAAAITGAQTTIATGAWHDMDSGLALTSLGSGYYRLTFTFHGPIDFRVIPQKNSGQPNWIKWQVTSYTLQRI